MRLRLKADLKLFMKSDKTKLPTIKSILSEITYAEKANSKDSIMTLLQRAVKKREDAISQYIAGGREELAKQELFEISVLKQYIPEQISDAKLAELAFEAVVESGAKTVKDLGKVLKLLAEKVPEGAATKKDMADVAKKLLSQ